LKVEEMGTVVSLQESDDMLLWDGTKGSGTELSILSMVMEGSLSGWVAVSAFQVSV
jgi:riboflavin synthase